MNTRGLRLGSWIWSTHGQYDRIQCKVTGINLGHAETDYDNSKTELRYIEPIPLTEEWLLKCGAEDFYYSMQGDKIGFVYDRFVIVLKPEYGYWYVTEIYDNAYITKVEFVHEWQNLIFVLNGKELEFEET